MHRGGSAPADIDTKLIEALLKPAAFHHACDNLELLETHISWIVLAGEYAYKIKKPVLLPFVDFRELAQRKFYCEEEIRLNRPFAPEIYIGVVPITVDAGQARFGGRGAVVEYAVHMHRFEQQLRLDQQLERGQLSVTDMHELGRNIAARHVAAAAVDSCQRARCIELTRQFMRDNFSALRDYLDASAWQDLWRWTSSELQRLDQLLWHRFDAGFVRDCHGDLHLGNLIRLPSGISTFDCIEFSTDLRHIDVACDFAFLVMDLVVRQRRDLAAHFLNRYLECTGDYGSLRLFRLYFVYRCLVRAKVAAIRCEERQLDVERQRDLSEVQQYGAIAAQNIVKRVPTLVVMSGLSASGKSWISRQLMATMPAIRVRSDLERKRMLGLEETEDSKSAIASGIYRAETNSRVYARLNEIAKEVLVSGHNVILDAAFLHQVQRSAALAVAREVGASCILLAVEAPPELLRERLRMRRAQASDASEAGIEVLEYQMATAEPLIDVEKRHAVVWHNTGEPDVEPLFAQIIERTGLLAPASCL